MNSGILRQQLESFGRGPFLLSAALEQFPKKMWLYKPSDGLWSIHENILHLADSEAHAYIRCRRFIAEPGSSIAKFDSESWARNLGYFHQSTREALRIIRNLRGMTYELLVALPESVWEHSLEHATEGRLTLSEWLRLEEDHIPRHIDQMKCNYEKWLEKRTVGVCLLGRDEQIAVSRNVSVTLNLECARR
jgi:DinB superfamily